MAMKNPLPIKTGQLFIIGAVVMAVVSAGLIQGLVNKPKGEETSKAPPKVETIPVVVAKNPMPAGTKINAQDIMAVDWPVELLPGGGLFEKTEQAVGRIVKKDILPREPIYKAKLAGDQSFGGLPVVIPNGMRAVTVAVSETKGVGGFVKPGSRVDILSTFEVPIEGSNKNEEMTKTVLQNVMVLATAQQMLDLSVQRSAEELNDAKAAKAQEESEAAEAEQEKENKSAKKKKASKKGKSSGSKKDGKGSDKDASLVSSVTVAVSPADAEKLVLAEEYGRLRLLLRPEEDYTPTATVGVTRSELVRGRRAPAMKAPTLTAPPLSSRLPATPGYQVEFIQGVEKRTVSF
ncbi:MAG: Flp pilus assembly protein CpaB [Candidatus Melainabacteria bacterium]|nr:Flp pilus assembly protein CpaB [Candidatus Melainabacteria bacterium]